MKNDWELKKLGEICDIFAGGDVPKGNFSKTKTEKYTIPIYSNGEKNKGLYGYTNITRVRKPSITISARGTIGYTVIREGNFYPAIRLVVVTPNYAGVDLNYLMYFISRLTITHSGSSIPQLTVPMVKEFMISLPPLKEQKRIVTVLESVFKDAETAKENAEKNLQNSKDLFEAYLDKTFNVTKEGWEKKCMDDIAEITYGYTDTAKDMGDFRFIRITDIDENGELLTSGKKYIDKSGQTEGFILRKGELLMVRTGATYGKVLLFDDGEKSVFASFLIKIGFREKIINKLFWYFSKSKMYWDQVNSLVSGTAQPQFNGNALKRLIFTFPTNINEQDKIIKKFDQLFSETRKLETVYFSKLKHCQELQKSVLNKAFRGEL